MRTIFLFLIAAILHVSCNKQCPPSTVTPIKPIIYFSLTDSTGNDLFFGKDRIYDPQCVAVQNCFPFDMFFVDTVYKCFKLYLNGGRPSFYCAEFTPGNIDTIKIESRYTGWYEEPEGCRHFTVYENNFFFNNSPVCENCFYTRIYKIAIK
jgi:hypothetical protein